MVKKKPDYWTIQQEEAIKKYLNSDKSSLESQKEFERDIYPALKTLVENILFTYRLSISDISIEEQINDALGFIMLKLDKFDPNLGYKAYSYFGTIAKRYFIAKKKKLYNNKISMVELEELDGIELQNDAFSICDTDLEEDSNFFFLNMVAEDFESKLNKTEYIDPGVYKLGEAIIFLLKNYKKINVTSKNQFYFIAREYTGMKTKEITRSLKVLKTMFSDFNVEMNR